VKIALILPGFSDGEGDWCIPFCLNLVRGLATRHEVHVFSLRYPTRQDTYSVYGATVHSIGGHHKIRGLKRISLGWRALSTLVAQHRRSPFDVIHGMWADEPGMLAVIAGRLLKRPVAVSLVGGELTYLPTIQYGVQGGLTGRFMTRIALRANRIIAPSPFLADMALKAGITSPQLVRVPFGVDTQLFTPESLRATPTPTLLAIGNLIPVKNHAGLLRAFAKLTTPGVCLKIIGEGGLLGELRALADQLGVAERVEFVGSVRHDRLPDYYRSATLHVVTSHHEGFQLVVTEAAACGLPTMGYEVGIMAEIAATGGAVATERGNETALATAIDALLSDPITRQRLAHKALAVTRERYSTEAMVSGVEDVYRAIVT
jgi:glycosyltransferase involved in cell wall biosynthesis